MTSLPYTTTEVEPEPIYCGYETMLLVLRNPHIVSPQATSHAIDWISHFNRWGREAFTLPLTLAEANSGIIVHHDENAGPQ